MEQIINYRDIPTDKRIDILNALERIGFFPAYGGVRTMQQIMEKSDANLPFEYFKPVKQRLQLLHSWLARPAYTCIKPQRKNKKESHKLCNSLTFKWTQRGMIPRPSDYESAALTDWAMGPARRMSAFCVAKIKKQFRLRNHSGRCVRKKMVCPVSDSGRAAVSGRSIPVKKYGRDVVCWK